MSITTGEGRTVPGLRVRIERWKKEGGVTDLNFQLLNELQKAT
jgi:hypothetical protein